MSNIGRIKGYSKEFADQFHTIEEYFIQSLKETGTIDISTIIKATKEQDLYEHWDYEVNGFKYDVKGAKKVISSDDEPNLAYNWVETQGSRGFYGWLYGKADYFAFECGEFFIIVPKQSLIDLIHKKCTDKKVTERPENPVVYKFYHRRGKHDIIVLVDTFDLMMIAENIIDRCLVV